MVQISDPDDLPRPVDQLAVGSRDSVDSDAITQSAIDGLGPDLHHRREPPDPVASNLRPPPPQAPVPASASPISGESAPSESDQYRDQVEGVWRSESTQRTTQLAFVALLSLFGLIASAVVFSQFVHTWRQQEPVAAVPTQAMLDAAEKDVAAAEAVPGISDPAADPLIPEPPESPATMASPVEQPSDTAASPANSAKPATSEPATSEPATVAIPSLVSPPFEIQATTAANAQPGAATSGGPGDAQTKAEGDAPPPMNNLPPGLRKYVPLLSLGTSENPTAEMLQAPPTIDTVRIEDAAAEADPDVEASALRKPADVDKVFAQRFAIDNNGTSLAELMLVVSQLTTVPIEIDLIALDAAAIPIGAPVKTPGGWIAVRQWIDETCASLGLTATTVDGRVVISASDDSLVAGISSALQLDDFGDQAASVYRWLSPLLDEEEAAAEAGEGDEVEAPVATSLAEDGRSIVPGPSLRSRLRAAFAIEAVRLMRGMPARMDRWRTSRWIGPWPAKNALADDKSFGDWPLIAQGDGGTRLDAPRAAAGLLRSIASLNERDILVGWYDATRQGLYPADPVMPYSREMTAAGMLEEILGEHGLQTRVCGPALWYVCSEASYDRFEVITWYTIPEGTGDEIVQRIANSLSISDLSVLPAAFDEHHLLIRCPRYLARQIPRIISP